jgi:ribose/xylose/arabinose/galactoside ABC-type transport system permease subunit
MTTTPPSPSPTQPAAMPALAEPRRRRSFGLMWPLLALAALLLYNLIFSPAFFSIQVQHVEGFGITDLGHMRIEKIADQPQLYGSLIDVMRNGSRVMLLSLGMTLVIATGGIDLSVGTIMAIAGCVMATLIAPPPDSLFVGNTIGHNALAIIAITLLVGLLAGCWNGTLASLFNIQPIIATLILMIAGRGLAQLITGGAKPTYSEFPAIDFIGKGFIWGVPVSVVMVIVAGGITILLTRATAVGNNAAAAEVAGIHAKFVKFSVYAFTGLCAAAAGMIPTSELRFGDHTNTGLYSELDAIVAVAIGGTSLIGGRFSLLGSLLGAFIMQALRTTILSNSNKPEYNLVIQAAVVLFICLLQAENLRLLAKRGMRALSGRPA